MQLSFLIGVSALAMGLTTRSLKVSFAITSLSCANALSLLKSEDKLWKLTSTLSMMPLISQVFAPLSEVNV
ncbi:MAG: hypothetical protein V7L14_03815 [Nostoc sp.]|uniref:hypothetical protein n=1 Tax=Nostoc sp. TaxID=1180 RepID=UPI002FF64294